MRQSTVLSLLIFFILHLFSLQIRINLRKSEISSELKVNSSQSNPNLIMNPYLENNYEYWEETPYDLFSRSYTILNPQDHVLENNFFAYFDIIGGLWLQQEISTEVNVTYQISFFYISYLSHPSLVVKVGDVEYVINDSSKTKDILYEYKTTFIATSPSTMIRFEQISISESNGSGFTNVVVVKEMDSC